jgi:hypothetical protein
VLASSTQQGVAGAKPLIRMCRSIVDVADCRPQYDNRYALPPRRRSNVGNLLLLKASR